MSAPKFTPGPWCAWQADPRGSRFSVTGPTAAWAMVASRAIEEFQPGAHCQEVISGAEKQTVAMVFGENEERATHAAHLIAAAPDLYEALRGLCAQLLDGAYAGESFPDGHAMHAARAALAKAEGKR